MSIITNIGNVPYLSKYTPYSNIPANSKVLDAVTEMVSVNFVPFAEQKTIQYYVGAKQNVEWPLKVKNVTTNVPIKIQINASAAVFNVDTTEKIFTLAPGQEKQIMIQLNKNALNYAVSGRLSTTLSVTATNTETNTPVFKNLSVPMLERFDIPPITIVE